MVTLECFFEDGVVEVACSQQDCDGVAQSSAVLVDILLHNFVIGHFYNIWQSAESVGIGLCVELGVNACCFAAFVEDEEVACLPIGQEAVDFVCLHSFGQFEAVVQCVCGVFFLCQGGVCETRGKYCEEYDECVVMVHGFSVF